MYLLAIEQSTPSGCLALLDDNALLAQEQWQNERLRNQEMFRALPRLLRESGRTVADLDLFAVGLGPGSFAGVRTALAAAEGMAMVDRTPVAGVSSGAAIAWSLHEEGHAGPIAVVGDARRRRLWVAVFDCVDAAPGMRLPYALVRAEELTDTLRQAATVATPEWSRIGDFVRRAAPASAVIVKRSCSPHAAVVGRLALRSYTPGSSPPMPVPIYLHPPVFVAPK